LRVREGKEKQVIRMKKLELLPINTPKQAFQNPTRKPKNISHSKFPFHLIQYSTETNNPQICDQKKSKPMKRKKIEG